MPENNIQLMDKLFCCYYLVLGNITEAACQAGFPQETCLKEGMRILNNNKYRKFIRKLNASEKIITPVQLVQSGLERIAFGSANDAAYLVFSDELPSPNKLSSLDLFNVSEIKRVKGGGIEVKLFDRQKALEKMYEYASASDNGSSAQNLIDALTRLEVDSADGNEI